jgi:hypothetical protein
MEETMSDDPDDDQDAGQDTCGSTGVFTLPEITITGSASAADSDTQDSDTTSPVLAGITPEPVFPTPVSPVPGGPPPSWSPDFNLQSPKTPGFEPPLDFRPPPGSAIAPQAAAAPEATEATGLFAAAGTAAGVAAMAAGAVVGAGGPIVVGYVIDHAEELNQAPDPDLQSLPGGAPLPAGPDLDAGAAPQANPSPASLQQQGGGNCDGLFKSVADQLKLLEQLREEAAEDKQHLWELEQKGECGPDGTTWSGHKQAYDGQRQTLAERIKEWEGQCPGMQLTPDQQEELEMARDYADPDNDKFPDRPEYAK